VPNAVVGTFRTVRLVKQLAVSGWDTTVLTGKPSTYAEGTPVQADLERLVPEGTFVARAGVCRGLTRLARLVKRLRPAPAPRPAAHGGAGPRVAPRPGPLRVLRLIEQIFAIPDAEAGWFAPAVMRGVVASWRRPPDVIYSSAPPWTGHLVAGVLAAVLRRPWVADFRDPWARAPWRDDKPRFVRRAWAALESLVVRRAAALLFTTGTARDEFARHYGSSVAARCHVVRNGCDVDDVVRLSAPPPAGPFTLAHVGSLYGYRNPLPLLRALAAVLGAGLLDRRNFRLRLIGSVALHGVDLASVRRELGLEDVVEFVPHLPRGESQHAMASASALLLVQPAHALSVPAKTYEYFAAARPILALADEGETAELIRASGMGEVVSPADDAAIAAALVRLVEGRTATRTSAPANMFDGRVRAAEMVEILRSVGSARCTGALDTMPAGWAVREGSRREESAWQR
jgi:glycosyltransferase involved in cell wall biosynthesis